MMCYCYVCLILFSAGICWCSESKLMTHRIYLTITLQEMGGGFLNSYCGFTDFGSELPIELERSMFFERDGEKEELGILVLVV